MNFVSWGHPLMILGLVLIAGAFAITDWATDKRKTSSAGLRQHTRVFGMALRLTIELLWLITGITGGLIMTFVLWRIL